jgi:EmrB/QacA subfamily drug resistance transporter
MNGPTRGPCDEGILRSIVPSAPGGPRAAPWVIAATVLGSGMAFLDGTVVNVALPVLQKSLNASVSGAQWVVESYLLFLSSLVLVGGSLADRFGRRRVFMAGVVLFAVTSAACGLAINIEMLILARAVQGIGAALLVPASLAILGAAFPAASRGRAVGTWSSLTAMSAVVGPLLGGWLVQVLSWRAAFFLNLPIAAAVLGITLTKISESRNEKAGPLDWPGALLATIGLAGLVYGLIEAPDAGWSAPRVAVSLAAGVVALAGFGLVEHRSRHPTVPPELFRNRTFVGANLLTLCLYAALSAAFFFLPFDLIQAQGYSPAQAGAAILPMALLLFALSRPAGAIADRFGPRIPLTVGPTIAAIGFFLLSLPRGSSYTAAFLPALVVLGLGMSITVAPLTAAVLSAVDSSQEGTASGVNNAVARVAGLLAIAALGVVASRSFEASLASRLAQPGFSEAARAIPHSELRKLGAARPPADLSAEESRRVEQVIAASLDASIRVVMTIAAMLALLGAASAAFCIETRRSTASSRRTVVRDGSS